MNLALQVLESKLDASVNFVASQPTGYLESRYVKRPGADYFICYLSSQTGCNRGCQFCHLTTSGQTTYKDAKLEDFLDQADLVFKHYHRTQDTAKYVHFNFMARGEPLANNFLIDNADMLLKSLQLFASKEGFPISKLNISTIMPKTLRKPLVEVFREVKPVLYYSLYSLSTDFRSKWIPGAMSPLEAGNQLRDYQKAGGKLKIHYAFIQGENDSLQDVEEILNFISLFDLKVDFNIVRYNSASETYGRESAEDVIWRNFELLKSNLQGNVQVIDRVGKDVHASCGTFFSG